MPSQRSDTDTSSMRVGIKINDDHQELRRDLERIKPYHRGGRLKLLATIGLKLIENGLLNENGQPMIAVSAASNLQHSPPPEEQKSRLLGKFVTSLSK